MHIFLSITQINMISGIQWKVTSTLLNNSVHNFILMSWNIIFFICWYFYILVTYEPIKQGWQELWQWKTGTLLKGRAILNPKKQKSLRYSDLQIVQKDWWRQRATETMTAKHMIMGNLTRRVVSCLLSQEQIQCSKCKVSLCIPHKYAVLYHRNATREGNTSNNVKGYTFWFTQNKILFYLGLYELLETILILVKTLQNSAIFFLSNTLGGTAVNYYMFFSITAMDKLSTLKSNCQGCSMEVLNPYCCTIKITLLLLCASILAPCQEYRYC